MKQSTIGIIYALIAYFLWIVGDSFYKYLGESYSILDIGFYGKTVTLGLIVAYLFYKQQNFTTHFPRLQLYRSLALTINFLCVLYAYKHMKLSDVALIFYASPFITALLSRHILKEDIGIHRIISIVSGFIGMIIIVRPGYIEPNPALIPLLIGVISFSYSNILSRQIGDKEPKINFVLLPTLCTVIFLLPFLLANPTLPPLLDFSFMAAGGLIGSASILLISLAYIKTHAVTVSILGYTDIFWTILLGYLIFNDVEKDPMVFLGGAIIILSGIYLVYREANMKSS